MDQLKTGHRSVQVSQEQQRWMTRGQGQEQTARGKSRRERERERSLLLKRTVNSNSLLPPYNSSVCTCEILGIYIEGKKEDINLT